MKILDWHQLYYMYPKPPNGKTPLLSLTSLNSVLQSRMSSPQPHSQPHPQMCGLKYNYCECKGCHRGFRKFQEHVEKKYKIPKPSLDKQHGIVIVIGTADATGVRKLFKEATKRKYVEILPIAAKVANQPPPPQPQPPREATNMGSEEGIAPISRGNMLQVGESSRMGQMGQYYPMNQIEQRGQCYSIDDNKESPWNSLSDENAQSCTIM